MLKHLKSFFPLALALLFALLPDLALAVADQANPTGRTDWDLYVYGNGRIIFDILNGIKMLMVPDSGETGFNTLLMVMATIGFLVLAVSAGFDPGKNLMRMFTYILVVWGVSYGTTQLTANVVIQDLARDPTTGAGTPDFRVQGAPALVVLPAALTSEVGRYFTQIIETYFTIPGEMKLAGQGVGQFNLFGRMMREANQYVITSPELKKSLSAYTSDCAIPSMAMGRLTGVDMKGNAVSGADALLHARDMMAVLATARSKSLLTKYYPFSVTDVTWNNSEASELTGLAMTANDLKRYQASGVLVSCETSFNAIKADVEKNANLLLQAGSDAWAKTGVMVPFETAFTTMLAQVAAPGSVAGGFSRPSGFIMQQAMVNSMNGSFRQAAIQTGNNDLMQAAALSQAEAQQKSAWVSSFAVFNNMMGYVFTVLQAFIFAITPLVVIALMVPGMGKSIFTNYAQILVWLTLWQPMLSIINFIITLFGTESISSVVNLEGGLSPANNALITEKTNDLMVAAGFLGTMTPLLSWGIVKGAMAFTEFINAGVGSQFATQAGAAAATGNMSMNNMTMDNTGIGKYNTQASSAVGTQAVSTGLAAGAHQITQDGGGTASKANGGGINATSQVSQAITQAQSEMKAVSSALSFLQSSGMTMSQAQTWGAQHGSNSAESKAVSRMVSAGKSASVGNASGESTSFVENTGTGRDASGKITNGISAEASFSAGLRGLGSGASVGGSTKNSTDNSSALNASAGEQTTRGHTAEKNKLSSTTNVGNVTSVNTTNTGGSSSGVSESAQRSSQAAVQRAASAALSETTAISNQLSRAQAVTEAFGISGSMGLAEASDRVAAMNALTNDMNQGMASIQARGDALSSGLGSSMAGVHHEVAAAQGATTAAYSRLAGSGGGPSSGQIAAMQGSVGGAMGAINKGIGETSALTGVAHDRTAAKAASVMNDYSAPSAGANATALRGVRNHQTGTKTVGIGDKLN